jgi:nucleotide-binding universal stress UspA family protein
MTIANILVPLDGIQDDATALMTAFAAAAPFGAHVSAVFSHPNPREVIPLTDMPISPEIIQGLIDGRQEENRKAEKLAREAFLKCAKEAGAAVVQWPEKTSTLSASYRDLEGHQPYVLEDNAFSADLVVFPPLMHGEDEETHDAFVRLLTRGLCPALLSPLTAPKTVGRKIAIGWDGRKAAQHAVKAALPFLENAEKVELFTVSAQRSGIDNAQITDFLSCHGIRFEERVILAGSRSTGDALMKTAVSNGHDMLVVGGYGHSRLAQDIFGGVTDHIVSHPALPIFMVH